MEKKLSYFWEKAQTVFGNSLESSIKLGVGTHKLTFKIKADAPRNINSRSNISSETEAEDDVIITVKPYTPGDEDDESTSTASSWDPNEKVGTAGVGDNNCLLPNASIDYTIYFENDAEKATLAAQKVTVYDVLDEAFDLSTFEFTGAEVANTTIDVPTGLSEYSTLTDLRPNNNLLLKTELKLDVDTRTVTAEFSSIDPETGEFTKDVWAGFLPPNDENHSGEGHFSYRVNLREDVANEYNVTNIADIYFDYNDCISTNQTSHFIDIAAPESLVNSPVSESSDKVLSLNWTGYDLSGIQYYDIYVSDNENTYKLWQNHTTETTADFEGEFGHSYSFYSIATDLLGHVENKKNIPDVTVKFTENGSGITDVVSDDVKTSITVNPSIPKANESCTIQVTGLDIYKNLELRIYDVSGRLRSVLKNVQGTTHHTFNQSGIYIISAYSDGNVIDIDPVKVIVN